MTDSRQESREAFDDLLGYIQREVGFETGFYNDAYLDRRITARMRRTGADSYGEYRDQLTTTDGEQERLLDSLSINVTGFFRNPEAWSGIRDVLRRLTDERRSVRAWSAPCADGREPYSLAMLALDDPEINARRLSILGTDISDDSLNVARQGVYETSQTTDIGEELAPLEDSTSYVEQEGDRFEVKDRVKDLVEFENHDLIRGDPKRDFDLVLCRNLLIYIDSEYKVPIFETIEGSLRGDGYLVIGMTETLPHECRDTFEPFDKRHRIYRKA
ncbi:chemotaxis protein methyltransferase CheR [Halorientalis persicus]|jgi:chemotaxis protein methyltransferase CheR|uniref:protein-glutamate O-methyltransferase n=1 Tax=Halorientalis persicus TaxID=1367881 RepID=A0A1H8NTD1_9EURY|nr:protein-glutamate O-methyltransferase CheR [Halorientalis persicus]SEO32890.1 chemotaxis protein methyltransferase CheR [Halorientalis persicus]